MITCEVENIGSVKKIEYTVYSNQGTPDVYFNNQYVGKISGGQLKVKYPVQKEAISITLQNTTVPSSIQSDSTFYYDIKATLIAYGTTLGTFGKNDTITLGGYDYPFLVKTAGNNPDISSRWSALKEVVRYYTHYAPIVDGTIPAGQTSVTINYYSWNTTETLSSGNVQGAFTSADLTGGVESGVARIQSMTYNGNTYLQLIAYYSFPEYGRLRLLGAPVEVLLRILIA